MDVEGIFWGMGIDGSGQVLRMSVLIHCVLRHEQHYIISTLSRLFLHVQSTIKIDLHIKSQSIETTDNTVLGIPDILRCVFCMGKL